MCRSRRALGNAGLKPFELVQLANLCPTDADQAKTLIPSLQNRDDDQLQVMLNELASLKQFSR